MNLAEQLKQVQEALELVIQHPNDQIARTLLFKDARALLPALIAQAEKQQSEIPVNEDARELFMLLWACRAINGTMWIDQPDVAKLHAFFNAPARESSKSAQADEEEVTEIMMRAYWGEGLSRKFDDIDSAFKKEMREGMCAVIQALRAKGLKVVREHG